MNVFAGIAACFHTVKTFSNFELNHVRLIWPFNANACFAFIQRSHTVFFTTLERSTDVVRQRNGNLFMMKTVDMNRVSGSQKETLSVQRLESETRDTTLR